MKKITIAIDGFSSTGKSTLAKQLAKALNYLYVDTGAMYRAVTFYAMKNEFISEKSFEKENLIENLSSLQISFQLNPEKNFAEVYLNGENVENQIRTLEVSQYVSQVAAVPEVRKILVHQQQEMGRKKGVVMDGRDIGTVVFPDAELKIFMTASAEKRAQRRYEELKNKGEEVSYKAVFDNILLRDEIDSSREDSPLMQAEDALVIDNTALNLEEQFQRLLDLAHEKMEVASEKE